MATLILFLSFLLFTVSPSQVFSTRSEKEIKLLFEGWLVKHHKNYNSLFEKEKRYNIFKDKLKFIDEHNAAGNHSITLGLTVFADLTNDEYRKTYLGFRQPVGSKMSSEESTNGYYHFNESESLPDSVDWRLNNAVTPLKSNTRCNSVWAFSAVAAVEGLNAIDTGSLTSLSEQEIMDCSGKGCRSDGVIEDAYKFIISNRGIDTGEDYPYQNRDFKCDTIKLGRRVASIDGYRNIPPNNEHYLKKVVAKQPVSVMIDINGPYFESYESGIFDEPCDHTELNYAVAVVGYGSEDGKDYWLIKNSWGEGWGENGYMRLRRNIDQPQGKCGITLAASYPVKSSKMNIDDQNTIEEKAVLEQISAI